jgi:peptidoglycan/xylan/chitin deacetylase (PgdA/CDA1 family)
MVARNGIDAQVFDGLDVAHGTDKLSLYDHSWGASVNPNQFNILVTENDDRITAVRPYGVTGAVSIPTDGFVVAANGTSLPYLSGLAVEDVLFIRPTDVCSPRTCGVPVAMFHDLGTDPANFEATLQAIDALGYTTLTQDELAYFLSGEDCSEGLPENPIVLTFDDAYISHFDFAPGLLDAYGMVGTFFVITSYPGNVSWVASWSAINDAVTMYPDAVELGCHSNNAHVMVGNQGKYLTMTETEREADLAACIDALELHTGISPTAIAWPFGAYDEDLVGLAEDAGFSLIFTTWPGLNHPGNSDAPGHLRRFGTNVADVWAGMETTIDRWHVCENL